LASCSYCASAATTKTRCRGSPRCSRRCSRLRMMARSTNRKTVPVMAT